MHNKMIREAAKEILAPYGIFQKGQSRIWIDDNNWFLTIIEFQPSAWSRGSYLNVGLFFLWQNQDFISFDFSSDQVRVDHENGVQLYFDYENDEQFIEAAKFLAKKALEKALYYRKFKHLDYAEEKILPQHFQVEEWGLFHKMILCFLAQNMRAFDYLSSLLKVGNWDFIKRDNDELLKNLTRLKDYGGSDKDKLDFIRNYICATIGERRSYWRTKGMKKLPFGSQKNSP